MVLGKGRGEINLRKSQHLKPGGLLSWTKISNPSEYLWEFAGGVWEEVED